MPAVNMPTVYYSRPGVVRHSFEEATKAWPDIDACRCPQSKQPASVCSEWHRWLVERAITSGSAHFRPLPPHTGAPESTRSKKPVLGTRMLLGASGYAIQSLWAADMDFSPSGAFSNDRLCDVDYSVTLSTVARQSQQSIDRHHGRRCPSTIEQRHVRPVAAQR